MDKILYKITTERPGNDTWLRYRLSIGYDFGDLICRLDENHNGWQGNHKNSKSFKIENNADTSNNLMYYLENMYRDRKEELSVLNDIIDILIKEDIIFSTNL